MACAFRGDDGPPEVETCKLVVTNIPKSCSAETLSNFLESRLDKDVIDIKQEPGAKSVALVTFKQPVDIFKCRPKVSAKTMAEHTLEVDSVAVPQGVVVWGLQPSVGKEEIASLLQNCHPGEITLHASLRSCIIPLDRWRDVGHAIDLLKNHCEHVEPHYDTFHREVFSLLTAPPNQSSPVKEQRETGNLVIRDISNEVDSDSDSAQSSPRDPSKAGSGSTSTKPQETKRSSARAEEPQKPTSLPRAGLQEPPAHHKTPPSHSSSGNQVKTTTEPRQLAVQKKPAPKQVWGPQTTSSSKMASFSESSDVAVPSAKDQCETLTIGVAQLGLLTGSGYFDSITKCSVTVDREAGLVTMTGSPGITVAAKMELKFKAGTIQTETFTVSREAARKLKMTSDPAWAAKPDQVYVDVSDSGTVTCAAFKPEEKSRAVAAIKSVVNPQDAANKPSAASTPVLEKRDPDRAWGENRVVVVPCGKSAHKTPACSNAHSEEDPAERECLDLDDQNTSVDSGSRPQDCCSNSGNQAPPSGKTRDGRESAEKEISIEKGGQHNKGRGRGRWSSAEDISGNKENKYRHFGRGRGRGHHQSQGQNRGSHTPSQQEMDKRKVEESHPGPEEKSADRNNQSRPEPQAGGGREASSEPQKTEEFKLSGPKARCFLKRCTLSIKDIESKFRNSSGVWDLTPAGDEEQVTIKLKGPQALVTVTFRQLCDLAKRLWHEKIHLERDVAHSKPVELALLARGLRNRDRLQELCGGLEGKHKCFISVHLPHWDADSSLMSMARSAPPDAPERQEQGRAASASPPPSSHQGQGHRHDSNQRRRSTHQKRGMRSSGPGKTGAGYNPGSKVHGVFSGLHSPPKQRQLTHSMYGMPGNLGGQQLYSPETEEETQAWYGGDMIIPDDSPPEQPISKMIKFGSTHIHLKQGDIASEKANVLVCFVGEDRKLENSAVGQAFLKVGGSDFKQNFDRKAGDGESLVISSGGGQLQCDIVFTLVLKRYSSSSDKFLSKCVQNMLKLALELGADSIALPALGTGKRLAFPTDVAATACIQALASLANFASAPRSVTFVMYDRDCCQDFEQVMTSLENGSLTIPSIVGTPSPPRRVSSHRSPERKSQTPPLSKPPSGAVAGDGEVRAWSEAYVRVYGANKEECQAAKAAIHTRLTEEYLNKVSIQRRLIGSLRQDARKEIVQAATKEGIWVKFPEDRRKKDKVPKLTLQGESKAVLRAQNQVEKILEQVKSSMGTNHSASNKVVPKRGTREFLKYMAAKTEHQPPFYWDCYKDDMSLNALVMSVKDLFQKYHKVSVDQREYKEVEDVVMKTWRRDLAGHGKDAHGLTHKSIAIKKIKRVENLTLFKKYTERRANLFLKAVHQGQSFTQVERLPNSAGPILTTKHAGHALSRDIYNEVNEHYLLHGTKDDIVKGICANGIQSRLAGDKNMFGAGAYCAESSTKADQYADERHHRTPGDKTMLLVRVLLGQPYITSTPNSYKLPPCTKMCRDDKCHHSERFDSVIGDGQWNFREFVLFHEDQMYPEYIITYERR